jgi:ATP-dependent DNA ligase
VKLYSRPGNDLTYRFTLIVESLAGLRSRSYIHPILATSYPAHARASSAGGIVSKRLDSRYRSGHTRDWLKSNNPEAPALKRGRPKRTGAKNGGDG